jgi:hypothetical protein
LLALQIFTLKKISGLDGGGLKKPCFPVTMQVFYIRNSGNQREENLEDGLILEHFPYSAASNYKSTAVLHERQNVTELAFFGRDPGFISFCRSKIMHIRFFCCKIAEYDV